VLSPVIARLLIYGVNPFDVERVLQFVERTPLRNARQLEERWLEAWTGLATAWQGRRQEAAVRGRRQTAFDAGMQEACCHLAQFLINTGDTAHKCVVYQGYAQSYREAMGQASWAMHAVDIAMAQGSPLSGLLHVPNGPGPHPCVVLFAGLGSCKEEVHVLASRMVARRVAALVPDMPGCGDSLFRGQITCGADNLSMAFHALADFTAGRSELDAARLGTCGMCMGGGYAYRAAAEESRYRFCASLFPLFINQVEPGSTPQWMKSGDWYDLQTGGKKAEVLIAELGLRDSDHVACPFFLVHGKHDNWMTLERAMELHTRATSPRREVLVVEDEPVYSSGQVVTHTMPVGEQLGWVAPLVADWIAEQAGCLADGTGAA
jgi:dienelactone hydrolase